MLSTWQRVFIFDEQAFSKTLVKALAQRQAAIYDGVAYWAKNSGRTGIIEHLPLKEVSIREPKDILKIKSKLNILDSTISTALLIGVMIIQTQYLEEKLNHLSKVVNEIAKLQYFYSELFLNKEITGYLAQIKTTQDFLQLPVKSNNTNGEKFEKRAWKLIDKRNEILFTIQSLISILEIPEKTTEKQYQLLLNFCCSMLDILPKGIYIEFLLHCRAGLISQAEHCLLQGKRDYHLLLQKFRAFLNQENSKFIQGKLEEEKIPIFVDLRDSFKSLLQSSENQTLLSLPEIRPARIENNT